MKYSVLLVEDEALVREIIADYFLEEQWMVHEAENGREALAILDFHTIDLIILDIMMPELNGWEVCRHVRKTSDVPIIMLTAKGEDDDKVAGFELGADDYVTKPFSPRVLLARAKVLLKRAEGRIGGEHDVLSFGQLTVNLKSHSVKIAEEDVDLAPKEYDLLIYLIRHKGIVLSRDSILNNVWGYDYLGESRTVDTHIKKLRAKLGKESGRITTIIRAGYKFEANT